MHGSAVGVEEPAVVGELLSSAVVAATAQCPQVGGVVVGAVPVDVIDFERVAGLGPVDGRSAFGAEVGAVADDVVEDEPVLVLAADLDVAVGLDAAASGTRHIESV